MDKIQNLFKHYIPFPYADGISFTLESGKVDMTYLYKTDVIHNPERYGITDYHDIKRKIQSFLYYVTSKYKYNSRGHDMYIN